MHPARSIIVFTSLSGAGYGLVLLMALGGLFGLLSPGRWFGAAGLGGGLVLISAGLLSSLLHLGHPERAWRALSQWRSSWLSREGVASLLTFLPILALAWGWIVEQAIWPAAALLSALGSVGTIFCTAMIYASLKPIRQWRQPLVPPVYLLLALATGSLLLLVLLSLWGGVPAWAAGLAILTTLLAWGLKLAYWRRIDQEQPFATAESATGLGALGRVRLLESPHTEENYLLREMGYRVARKHSRKLRHIALILGLLLPLLCLLPLLAAGGWWEVPLALLAASGALAGTLVERWLFFAEATHTVTLFYGRQA